MMRSLILRKLCLIKPYTLIFVMESCLEIENIIQYQGDSTGMDPILIS